MWSLINLYLREKQDFLGAQGFLPIPSWVRMFLRRYTPSKQRIYYARLMDGLDLSSIAPDEVGCQESVSRIDHELFGDDIVTGTWTGMQHYITSSKWREVSMPEDGCTVIAATGTGNGTIRGHVGIYDGKRVWSNTLVNGRGVWSNRISYQAFLDYYKRKGGMPVRYFVRVSP